MKRTIIRYTSGVSFLTGLFLFFSCIKNDIPFPYQAGDILSIEVEGQRGSQEGESSSATIDNQKRTVSLFVNDSVDISRLKIMKLTVSPNVTLFPDSSACADYDKFPKKGFASLDSIPRLANTRMNFTNPVKIKLKTYQEYDWTITVKQIINREIDVENMIRYMIDPDRQKVEIYVSQDQLLTNIKVHKLNLGGTFGKVYPDPTSISDYSESRIFMVYLHGKEENGIRWTVSFIKTEEAGQATSTVFPMVNKAILSGTNPNRGTLSIDYKRQDASTWTTIDAASISVKGNTFSTTIGKLSPGTDYRYRISINGKSGEERSFTTMKALPLPNGSMDNWSHDAVNSRIIYPWRNGENPFWDTGNRGAATIGNSNSVYTSETSNGAGQAAKLESKFLLIKFAAGNIFTGSYVRTDGTNGVLSFGRPFSSFPTKLRFHYKYKSETINRIGDAQWQSLNGKPDSCLVYIALTDWDAPKEIRTKHSDRSFFDKNDPKVIAYAEMISGTTTTTYQQIDLTLQYRFSNRVPKYILIVASSSKYGDYFVGGEGSTLWLDNLELIYD